MEGTIILSVLFVTLTIYTCFKFYESFKESKGIYDYILLVICILCIILPLILGSIHIIKKQYRYDKEVLERLEK